MILAIIFAWMGYKKANENGRNGLFWGALATIAFIGTQLIVSACIGLISGIILLAQGNSEAEMNQFFDGGIFTVVVYLAAIGLSIGAGMIVLYFANKPIDTENYNTPPPPPTSFGQN